MTTSATHPAAALPAQPAIGFLTDDDVLALLNSNELIRPRTWHRDSIRHASYTLRVGVKASVQRARAGINSAAHARVEEVNIGETTPLVINPGDIAMVYCQEHLQLPADIIAFTVARGLLFCSGLGPENTYVDPGFNGPIYITLHNHTSAAITIPHLTPFARVFFYRLSKPAGTPYTNGGGLGIPQFLSITKLVEHDRTALSRLSFEELISSIANDPIIGDTSAELVRRLHRQWIVMVCLIPCTVALCVLAQNFTEGIKFAEFLGPLRDLPDWAKNVVDKILPQLAVTIIVSLAALFGKTLRLLWRPTRRD